MGKGEGRSPLSVLVEVKRVYKNEGIHRKCGAIRGISPRWISFSQMPLVVSCNLVYGSSRQGTLNAWLD